MFVSSKNLQKWAFIRWQRIAAPLVLQVATLIMNLYSSILHKKACIAFYTPLFTSFCIQRYIRNIHITCIVLFCFQSGLLTSLPYLANFFMAFLFGLSTDYCINNNILTCKQTRMISNTVGKRIIITKACTGLVKYRLPRSTN